MDSNLNEQARALQPDLVRLRRQLHRWPEPSGQEAKTAALLAQALRAIPGVEGVREGVFGHGLVAQLRGAAPGPVVALRADMDALRLQEETGLPFASENPGVMHACGHDFHMAILVGAARLLAQNRGALRGSVRFIFQPSEEASPVGGSRGMIAAGALEGVDAVFGLHVWPDVPFGAIGLKAGPLMACSDHFTVQIEGASAHAARPERGRDALVAGSQLVGAIQTLVSRRTSPLESAVVTVGRMRAGVAHNIVAQRCELEGTVRTLTPAVREAIQQGLEQMVQGVCAANGCTGALHYERGYAPTVNDAASVEALRQNTVAAFGPKAVFAVEQPTMISEDFGFYLQKVPGCFFWLGTDKQGQQSYPLHSSHFAPDESLLGFGAAVLANHVMRLA